MKLSFHIPISPHISFYSRLKWLRKSLDDLGDLFSETIFHIAVGNDGSLSENIIRDSYEEFRNFSSRYKFYFTEPENFKLFSHIETAALRYKNLDDADITVFCDADIFFVKTIEDLIYSAYLNGGIYGVKAWYSPFKDLEQSTEQIWKDLSLEFTGTEIPLNYYHSIDVSLPCPAYYNLGLIIGRTDEFQKIKEFSIDTYQGVALFLKKFNYATRIMKGIYEGPYFFSLQILLALSLHKLAIKTYPVSDIYNCANSKILANQLGDRVEDIRVVHYLKQIYINRNVVFNNNNTVDEFLSLQKMDPITLLLQNRVRLLVERYGYD